MCHLNECAQPACQRVPFDTYKNGRHVYLIRSMPPTPRSEPNELQNLHKNSAVGLSQKNSQRELTDIMVWL